MQSTVSALVIVFSAFLALWPAAFLVVAALHAFARRWRHIGQIALLVPLWSIAASIALVQFPRLVNAFEASAKPGPSLIAITAVIFALCCAAIAWALLIRSFAKPIDASPAGAHG